VRKVKRTYFDTIYEDIQKKDIRTIKSWCARHDLTYFKDGRDYYVLEEDYIAAFNIHEPVSPSNAECSKGQTKKEMKYMPEGKHSSHLMKTMFNF
jgi:hypothetical protein